MWQRNYYEHVIRNSASLDEIRRYIADNPLRWEETLKTRGSVNDSRG